MKKRIKEFFKKLKLKLNRLGRKKVLAIILASTVCVTAIGVGLGVSFARYNVEHSNDSSISAKNFYFVSTLLKPEDEGGNVPEYDLYSNTLKFDLKNYDDELRISEVDITYSVTITSDDGGAIPTETYTDCTISSAGANKSTVTYTNLTYGKTYTVTAKASVPYTKTIGATFVVIEGNYDVEYTVVDKNDYVLVSFGTDDFIGEVNISWQNGYVPDNSESIMTEATGTSHTTYVSGKSAYTIKFFKSNTGVSFDAAAFSVTKG